MAEQMTVDQAIDRVINGLEHAVSGQLAYYTASVEAINRTSLMAQRMATQRMVLGVVIRQRLMLEDQKRQAVGQPLLLAAIEAQAEMLDEELTNTLSEIGVPEKVARKQIEAATSNLKQIEIVERKENGRIAAMHKN